MGAPRGGGVRGGGTILASGPDLHWFPTGIIVATMISPIDALCLGAALFAALISTASLVLHWVRWKSQPSISEVAARLTSLNLEHLDLLDKVAHWIKRDSVRRAREKAEETHHEMPEGSTREAEKAALRARARAAGIGLPSVG